jgi:hypothetical protein
MLSQPEASTFKREEGGYTEDGHPDPLLPRTIAQPPGAGLSPSCDAEIRAKRVSRDSHSRIMGRDEGTFQFGLCVEEVSSFRYTAHPPVIPHQTRAGCSHPAMPPKSTQSSQGGKQTSLLGFFSKPAATGSNSSRARPPVTLASTSSARGTSSAVKSKTTTSEAAEKRRLAIQAATQSSPTGGIKTLASSAAQENGEASSSSGKTLVTPAGKERRPSTTNGSVNGKAEGKPKQEKVDSDLCLGSSPLSAVDVLDDDAEEETVVVPDATVESNNSKKENTHGKVDAKGKVGVKSDEATADVEMANGEDGVGGTNEEEEEDDDQPVRSSVSLRDSVSSRAITHDSFPDVRFVNDRPGTQRGR